jgi:membrane-bound serine protease (ClpP class)
MKKVNLTALTGKIGITDTNLSPAGTVLIDEEIYEAKTDGEFIEAGRGVRIIRVQGKKIIVIRV